MIATIGGGGAYPPALLLVTLAVMVRLAAAVYRVGMLMSGKKPTLKEIAHWMRAS